MNSLLFQVRNFLDTHESAPSAWCMVKSFHSGAPFTDEEAKVAYERSEGENDEDRNRMLDDLNLEQLSQLSALCLEICLEKLEE